MSSLVSSALNSLPSLSPYSYYYSSCDKSPNKTKGEPTASTANQEVAVTEKELNHWRDLFTCPLSYELFKDPVKEGPGTCEHYFEKELIEVWVVSGHETCPLSRNSLKLEQLVPQTGLKAVCALLDPDRVTPLTPGDGAKIREVEKIFSERTSKSSEPVSKEIHQSLLKLIAAKAKTSSRATSNYYGC